MDLLLRYAPVLIAVVAIGLLNLNLFATKSDLAEQESRYLQTFTQRDELKHDLDFLVQSIRDLKEDVKDLRKETAK